MKILTFNRWTAESFTSNKPYMVISITEPGVRANIPDSDQLMAICRVQFHDIDKNMEGCEKITIEQAKQIAQIVKLTYEQVECIVVHCEAGVSRSAGVSMAITDWMLHNNIDVNEGEYPFANRLVYRAVYKALMGEYDE